MWTPMLSAARCPPRSGNQRNAEHGSHTELKDDDADGCLDTGIDALQTEQWYLLNPTE
jgi:hypothetical protein